MRKPLKKIPTFKTEADERKFWSSHDTADYIDWSKAERVVLPNLKPTTKMISLRLPASMLNAIKVIENTCEHTFFEIIKQIKKYLFAAFKDHIA